MEPMCSIFIGGNGRTDNFAAELAGGKFPCCRCTCTLCRWEHGSVALQ